MGDQYKAIVDYIINHIKTHGTTKHSARTKMSDNDGAYIIIQPTCELQMGAHEFEVEIAEINFSLKVTILREIIYTYISFSIKDVWDMDTQHVTVCVEGNPTIDNILRYVKTHPHDIKIYTAYMLLAGIYRVTGWFTPSSNVIDAQSLSTITNI